MATLNMQFNQQEIEESQKDHYEIIPAGTYIAEINRSEIKQNKSGNGNRLSLTFKILDGNYAGRVIFEDITLQNANDVAMQIGRKQMAQLTHACGKNQVKDSQELHGIPMQIKVAIRKDKTGQYDDENTIKKFAPHGGQTNALAFGQQAPVAPATTSAPVQGHTPPPQTQTANTAPPWARS